MTRVLLVETASPKRVRKTAEQILEGALYPNPELTILCTADSTTQAYFSAIPGTQVIPLPKKKSRRALAELREKRFDVVRTFWTGEKKYRRMKLSTMRLRPGCTDVEIGDGSAFRLTWKAVPRFWLFRWKHPLPSDHYDFVPQPEAPEASLYYDGEKVLILQSADPPFVLRALDRLKEKHLFRNPRYTIFCRNRPEIVERFQGHPMISRVLTHTESRDSWRHLRQLRRERFDALMVFFTGDPSYWKLKYFVFLLGSRHKVIWNENNDCFFFSLGAWLALLAHRFGERSRLGPGTGASSFCTFRRFLLFPVKLVVFPFRFAWLLLVWLRLRMAS